MIVPLFIEDIEFEIGKIREKQNEKTVLLHIEEQHLNVILSILKSVPEFEDCTVYLYGSRVQGKSLQYSDVDMAVDYHGEMLPGRFKQDISFAFEKSLLPYTVDIIDINSISDSFRASIEKDFVKIAP